jgi:DNA-binding IclR family transcriptional regulator
MFSYSDRKESIMRVDQTILRQIRETEENAPGTELRVLPAQSGVPDSQQRRHLQLLLDGGYLTGQQLRPYRPAFAIGLTIASQRMLDDVPAVPRVAKSIGECAQRVMTNVAVGLIVAKAHAAGIML